MAAKEAARKAGLFYTKGAVDDEYEADPWNTRGGSAALEGAASGGYGGVPAFQLGGPREATRGMGNTTTQTERGYDNPEWNVATGLRISQRTPLQNGDLATGGQVTHIGDGANVPPWLQRALATGLRTAIGSVVPGASLAFRAGREFAPDENPFQNTAFETMMGRKPVEGPVAPDRLPRHVQRQNRNR